MDSKMTFDLLVVGATAPGIVAAVRAAREGLSVALVAAGRHLGGSLPSLGALETHYRGNRAPLLAELAAAVAMYYKNNEGEDSAAWRVCTEGNMLTYEPHVMAELLEQWVAAEPGITLLRGWIPVAVKHRAARVRAVTFRAAEAEGDRELCLAAMSFVEAGYEGDFMALAGAPYRMGRESREDYGEPRAGRVFTRWMRGRHPRAAEEGRLNLVPAGATTSEPGEGSTGAGDGNIQSYSYRFCLTDDPKNRRRLTAPPVGYDREVFAPLLLSPEAKARLRLPFHHRFLIESLDEMIAQDHVIHGHALPHRKRSWNATNLTGGGREYPTGDAVTRRAVADRHRDHALGLLWFLQNDPAMPPTLRGQAAEWGLVADEFCDTDHVPPQLYVREARRLIGRAVFTEHDALLAPGGERAPVHPDSVGITEFSLDSLACTTERVDGSLPDGQLFQMEVSRPGQVPFGVMLPPAIDNLLVVTTVSATHVGWGTIRQTPTLMHLAESAAWAVVLAARQKIDPANVDVRQLQHTLVTNGVMITFFNDLDMASDTPALAAVQYLGAQGFFASYDADLAQPLSSPEAERWATRCGELGLNVATADLVGRLRGEATLHISSLLTGAAQVPNVST